MFDSALIAWDFQALCYASFERLIKGFTSVIYSSWCTEERNDSKGNPSSAVENVRFVEIPVSNILILKRERMVRM